MLSLEPEHSLIAPGRVCHASHGAQRCSEHHPGASDAPFRCQATAVPPNTDFACLFLELAALEMVWSVSCGDRPGQWWIAHRDYLPFGACSRLCPTSPPVRLPFGDLITHSPLLHVHCRSCSEAEELVRCRIRSRCLTRSRADHDLRGGLLHRLAPGALLDYP